jgi:hypothetical protein
VIDLGYNLAYQFAAAPLSDMMNDFVILLFREIELKLLYVCPGSLITHTTIHHGKTDAMF